MNENTSGKKSINIAMDRIKCQNLKIKSINLNIKQHLFYYTLHKIKNQGKALQNTYSLFIVNCYLKKHLRSDLVKNDK